MSTFIQVKEMFVVVFEYGARRKPQIIGPFFDYNTATHWLQTQPDAMECKRLKYRRPHGKPQEFVRATIRPMISYNID